MSLPGMGPRLKKRRRQILFLAIVAVLMLGLALVTGFINILKGILLLLIPLVLILLGM